MIELQVTNTSDDPLTVILRASSTEGLVPGIHRAGRRSCLVGRRGPHRHGAPERRDMRSSSRFEPKSNGTSPITVQMLTPAGEEIGEPVTLTATVTAFTGLGQVLTAGLVLVLLTWWATHWRSRRRAALLEVRERHPSGPPVGS